MYDGLRHPVFGPLLVLCIGGFHVYKAPEDSFQFKGTLAFFDNNNEDMYAVTEDVLEEDVNCIV